MALVRLFVLRILGNSVDSVSLCPITPCDPRLGLCDAETGVSVGGPDHLLQDSLFVLALKGAPHDSDLALGLALHQIRTDRAPP